jgi:hypothetical protein
VVPLIIFVSVLPAAALVCLGIDAWDRWHGHRSRASGSIERVTFDHRNDDRVIEMYGDAAGNVDWAVSRPGRAT